MSCKNNVIFTLSEVTDIRIRHQTIVRIRQILASFLG